jgi:hypothetical protein
VVKRELALIAGGAAAALILAAVWVNFPTSDGQAAEPSRRAKVESHADALYELLVHSPGLRTGFRERQELWSLLGPSCFFVEPTNEERVREAQIRLRGLQDLRRATTDPDRRATLTVQLRKTKRYILRYGGEL